MIYDLRKAYTIWLVNILNQKWTTLFIWNYNKFLNIIHIFNNVYWIHQNLLDPLNAGTINSQNYDTANLTIRLPFEIYVHFGLRQTIYAELRDIIKTVQLSRVRANMNNPQTKVFLICILKLFHIILSAVSKLYTELLYIKQIINEMPEKREYF